MERIEIVQKVVMAIKEVLDESDINDNFIFSEDVKLFQMGLGFSSIDGVRFVIKLEEIFGILWPDKFLTFNDVLTIGQVSDVIEQCLRGEKA